MAYISFVKEWNLERKLPYKEALKQARDDYYVNKGRYQISQLSEDDLKLINSKNVSFLEHKFSPLHKGGKHKLCKCVKEGEMKPTEIEMKVKEEVEMKPKEIEMKVKEEVEMKPKKKRKSKRKRRKSKRKSKRKRRKSKSSQLDPSDPKYVPKSLVVESLRKKRKRRKSKSKRKANKKSKEKAKKLDNELENLLAESPFDYMNRMNEQKPKRLSEQELLNFDEDKYSFTRRRRRR